MLHPTLMAASLPLLVVTTCVQPSWAAPTVTAANRATSASEVNIAAIAEINGSPSDQFDRQLAQTFLARTSGVLQSIAVTAGARAGAAQTDGLGLRMAIAPFNAENRLLGEILSISPVDNVEPLPGFGGPFSQPDVLQASANFESSGIVLHAGSSYAMIFSAERLDDSFFILGGDLPDYEGGLIGGRLNDQPFQFQPITDLFFEVTVDAVPEPASLAIVLATLPFAFTRHRK
ncbi:hypothetical protein Mal64_11620 [Pseudobythopirellula maris]|uniref:PEP-CTERM protein-sorting domain-containing protein n=1 Tax=Pseudobythopirellula maris TaxID=2527991 RepID=A0A5C5ZUH3_9BACT|nr:hypothetical protein [Pseudobythopirellula maris]TWT90765.1 hypothetical protein Mal64_11620 [Pseudobythopirellula maris]